MKVNMDKIQQYEGIMNAMCTFMYLFVVYFSFAPIISTSTHRYVNSYFDIQVLMMVTETETLTSTLHHNIFTYKTRLSYAETDRRVQCVCVCVCVCVCYK